MNKQNMITMKLKAVDRLRKAPAVYVVLSGATKLPFVHCDETSFEDLAFIYFDKAHCDSQVSKLADKKYPVLTQTVANKNTLGLMTALSTMGVDGIILESGYKDAVNLPLSAIIHKGELKEGQVIIENPNFHLTAIQFLQEARRPGADLNTQEMKDLQEEMIAQFKDSKFITVKTKDGQPPVLKLKDGKSFIPVFTDGGEYGKFAVSIKGDPLQTIVVSGDKLNTIMPANVENLVGVAINPLGMNLQLNVTINRTQAPKKEKTINDQIDEMMTEIREENENGNKQ